MKDKRTLYQRVLTRPGAELHNGRNPPTSRSPSGNAVPAFIVLYVYGRHTVSSIDWLEVGSNSRGNIEGWIRADQAIDWKQTMVVAFTNPAGRNRLPLFRDRDYVLSLLESEQAVRRNEQIIERLIKGDLPPDFPAISIEPANYVDFTENFYLLPIMEAEEVFFPDGFSARLLKVASVNANETVTTSRGSSSNPHNPGTGRGPKNGDRRFDTGIAFVIDSTISMKPYIDKLREVMSRVYDRIQEEGLMNHASFALIAYRDNVDAVPGLEYVSRTYANFRDGRDATRFLRLARQVEEAKVSSRNFNEDAYAGVMAAIHNLSWERFGGRYIMLITDAGPRDAGDPLGQTGLNAALVREGAKDKGIAIITLHLLTPEGTRNHDSAAAHYRALSKFANQNLYYAAPVGDARKMGIAIDRVADDMAGQVKLVAQGSGSEQDFIAQIEASPSEDSKLDDLRQATARVGYAMKLAYLGRTEGTRAPSVFEAWVADRDVANPQSPALEVRVLLTKNQLSDLQETLQDIIKQGERWQEVSPKTFFEEIKSTAAIFSRDPNQRTQSGSLREYLDGLPYRSKVMNVSQDLWLSWGIGEQQTFLDEIDAKIKLYQQYHDDVDRWIKLSANAAPGEAVYPIPLDALP